MERERVRLFANVDEELELWDCGVWWVAQLLDDVSFSDVPKIVVWIAFGCEAAIFLFPDWWLEFCNGIGTGTMTCEGWEPSFTD